MTTLLNGKQLAELLGVCTRTVFRMYSDGRIPVIRTSKKKGALCRFDPDAVIAALKGLKAENEMDDAIAAKKVAIAQQAQVTPSLRATPLLSLDEMP